MRINLVILTLLFTWQCCVEKAKGNGNVTNEISMSVDVSREMKSVKVGDPFMLQICITNLSTNRVIFVNVPRAIDEDSGFFFKIISPMGKDIAKKRRPPRIDKGGNAVILKPGRFKSFEFDPRRICKFDQPGDYGITVRRKVTVEPDDREIEIVSRAFVLSVVSEK